MQTLEDYLRNFAPISNESLSLIKENLRPISYQKGEIITHAGEICNKLLFIQSGVQMSYYETEYDLHVVAFTYAPGICAIPDSFSFQKPSLYQLIALSDTEAGYITREGLQELFNQSREIETLFRIMAEIMLSGVIYRHIERHSKTIENRFRSFAERSPHLFQWVPHKYLASYLDIDPTNFSRLYNSIKI